MRHGWWDVAFAVLVGVAVFVVILIWKGVL